MSLYLGAGFKEGIVSLGAVHLDEVDAASSDADVAGEKARWSQEAVTRTDVLYFGVRRGRDLVGQFFLHDIDDQEEEALLGYHLFESRSRSLGIGTAALRLLQRYVSEETTLRRLLAITGIDNQTSRRMCASCGFAEVGSSREDPLNTVVLEWRVPGRAGERLMYPPVIGSTCLTEDARQ